jgi:SAM-dependent methyltransferase
MDMDKFYLNMVRRLLLNGKIRQDMSVLVVCGEALDAEIYSLSGFSRVVVTNLDDRHKGSWSTGAKWDRQDAERLSYKDSSFDLVSVHAGLHHCRMPHKALCEMYRVARKGVLVIEPCENWIVKIGRKLGVGQEYEVHAVAFHQLQSGGVSNTSIPNYVFRWTLDEIRRTIASFAPEFAPRIYSKSDLVVHWHDLRAKKNRFRFVLMLFAFPFLKACSFIIPNFGNNFCVYIEKAGDTELHPWLKRMEAGLKPDPEWFRRRIFVGK